MGSAFHQLCPRYSGTLTPTAPTANRLWETFTYVIQGGKQNGIHKKVSLCIIINPLKRQTKIAADDILIFFFYLSKKIRLDFLCESSTQQRIHMKHQILFSLKNNEKYS